ncbi:UNVERIFIED_CONTAM: hypothetical protein Cloal_2131 [Acetivibrio alkalicellulosi]
MFLLEGGNFILLLGKRTYNQTISILKNKKQLPPIFLELKELIYQKYHVTAINFVYEKIKHNNPENSYSLYILLLNNGDYDKMCEGGYGGYKKNRQKFIADEFYKLALKYNFDTKEHTKDVWLCFNDFHAELKDETNRLASIEAIKFIKGKYSQLPIWDIIPHFCSIVVFYFTKDQVKENYLNGINKAIKQDYFSILKKYDEFNLFEYSSFIVHFDSNEFLDKEYGGNLHYYFK